MALIGFAQQINFTTDPTAPLRSALSDFKRVLTNEQSRRLHSLFSTPKDPDVIAFLTNIDNDSQARGRRCVASRLCTFLEAVQQFTGVFDTFEHSNPAIAAALWGSVKLTIIEASRSASYFDKVTNMLMTVGKSSRTYRELRQLVAGSYPLQNALCLYYAAVVQLCTRVLELLYSTGLRRVFGSFGKSIEAEFEPCLIKVDEAAVLVIYEGSLVAQRADIEVPFQSFERRPDQNHHSSRSEFNLIARKVPEAHRKAQTLQRQMFRLRADIHDNLSTIDSLRAWRQVYQQRIPNTAEWLQHCESFLKWKEDENTSVLWCAGTLGMGKTVLVANIIAYLQQTRKSSDLVCYHFCDLQDHLSLSARTILGTLARQMIHEQIENADGDDLERLHRAVEDIHAEDVANFLLPYLRQDRNYYLIIDGLDEVKSSDIHVLRQTMATLCENRTSGLKIMYSGRPELRSYLFSLRKFDFQATMTKSILADDIDQYLAITLDYLLEEGSLKLGNPGLITEIIKTLKGVSEGVFLWSRLFVDDICAQSSDQDILKALQAFPRGIAQLIDMKMSQLRKGDTADQALLILRLCGVLKVPLGPKEYQELLSVSIGLQFLVRRKSLNNIMAVVCACRGLLSVNMETDKIYYPHHHIRQYLFSDSNLGSGIFDESDSNTYLGEICLTYLSLNELQRQPLPMKSNRLPQVHKFHFLDYARKYWIEHLKGLADIQHTGSWELFGNVITDKNSLAYKPWHTESIFESGDETLDMLYWSLSNEHHALLVYVLSTKAKSLTEEIKEEILCRTSTSSLTPRQVSIILRYGACQQDTLVAGFIHAAKNGLQDILGQYLATRMPVDSRNSRDGNMTALQAAAAEGHSAVVWTLLEAGADVNAPAGKSNGRTALHAATSGGYPDIVEMLLRAGAKTNNTSGWEALHTAIRGGDLNIANKLIAATASLKVSYASARTAPEALWKVGSSFQEELSVNRASGKDSATPSLVKPQNLNTSKQSLAFNDEQESLDTKETLGLSGIDEEGRTSLIWASEEGHEQVVKFLIRCGAAINAQGGRYGNALQSAAARGHMNVAIMLLDHGADINAKGGLHNNALCAAIAEGHEQIAQLLLRNGATSEPEPRTQDVPESPSDDQDLYAEDELTSEWQPTSLSLTAEEGFAYSQILQDRPASSEVSLRSRSVTSLLSQDEIFEVLSETSQSIEPPQSQESQLVTWTCSCGERLSDRYVELVPGAVETLQHCLQRENSGFASSSWCQVSIQTIWSAIYNIYIAMTSYGSSNQNEVQICTENVGVNQGATASSSNPAAGPSQDEHTRVPTDSTTTRNPDLTCLNSSMPFNSYLLLCMPEKFAGLKLYHQQIMGPTSQQISTQSISSDRQLFQLLNQKYRSVRKTGLSRIWPRTVVRVSMANFLVDLEKYVELRHYGCQAARPDCQCIPPTTNQEYHYNPRDPPVRPPIATNYLTHYFQNPDCIRSDSLCFTLNQIPKRLSECVVTSNSTRISAWGLEFEEGWHQGRLQKTLAWLVIIGTVVFFALWWGLERDVQGASGVASFCVGALALLGYLASSDPRMPS